MLAFLTQKDRKLGVADNARYDLPLHNCEGSGFLMLLVALMSFLAMMALAGSFVMHGVTERWSSGLENRATVEIPAREKDGDIRSAKDITALSERLSTILKKHPNIQSFEIMKRNDVSALVAPWLGEDISTDDIPLPGLITIQIKDGSEAKIAALSGSIKSVSPDIRLDTHESWLEDILRLAGSLKISALVITLIIGFTTVIAIAGAVRSRMAEFKADIELLHLMGASAHYISRQFQRHSVFLAFKGSLIGLAVGGTALLIFTFLSGPDNASVLPSLKMSAGEIVTLLSLPAFACAIAYLTARFTVLRRLSLMP